MIQPMLFAALLVGAAATGSMTPTTEAEDCDRTGPAGARISACTEVIVSREMLGGDLAAPYRLRALAYQEAHDYRNAIADYDRVLDLQPGNAAILFERAGAHASLRAYEQAIADYGRSLELEPSNARAYFMRGVNYYQLGEPARAVDDYGEALRLDPEFPPVYNERTWSLYLLGRYPEALTDIDRALQMRPDMAPALDTRGHVLTALGRSDEALAAFEQAIHAGGRTFVRLYQQALVRHGYYQGTADGRYSTELRDALAICVQEQCRLLK